MADKPARGENVSNPGAEKGVSEEGAQLRAKWANKVEFFLCTSTQIISVHSLWTFPLLTFHFGVLAYIPYCLSLFFCGMPLLFLGLAVGQYTSESGVTAWKKLCPMFQGIGIASLVILVYLNISNVLLPIWSLFYLYSSFQSPPPWTTCDNHWNTMLCVNGTNPVSHNIDMNQPDPWNTTLLMDDLSSSSEMEFWRFICPKVLDLGLSEGPGWMPSSLIPCVIIVWVLSYFCTWKGIKYTGKVLYVVTIPYLLLIIFFIFGLTLPGAGEGYKYFFHLDFRALSHSSVWLFSGPWVINFCAFLGLRTSLGSYNKYNNDCYRDCLILCALHVGTSIFFSCLIFSFVGFLAHTMGLELQNVLHGGMELLFIVFPRALSMVNGASFWTVLFFLMIALLTLSHQFVLVECLATNVSDLLPRYLRKLLARELLVLVICGLCLLLGLLNITKIGLFLINKVDMFGLSNLSFNFLVCFECIIIAWVYGADRFYDNIADMIGYVPFPVLKYCWLFILPLTCGIDIVLSLGNRFYFMHEVNLWERILGFILIVTPLMCIPAFMLISFSRGMQNMATPSADLRQAHPHKPALTLCKRVVHAGRADLETSEAIMM